MKRSVVTTVLSISAIFSSQIALVGCQKPVRPPPVQQQQTPPAPQYMSHEIRFNGETLAVIAAWYTGKATNWSLIRDANPGLRPERLRIGQIVQIPAELMIKNDPLPQAFVRKFVGGSASSKGMAGMSGDSTTSGTAEGTQVTPNAEAPKDEAPSAEPTPVVSNPAADAPTPPAAEVKNDAQPAVADPSKDAERDKLLDELLK